MGEKASKILEIIEKYELPKEYHAALWDAYEQGTEDGFWRAVNDVAIPGLSQRLSKTGADDV
jgi:hypothetical protein